jgi:hypothetical protein
MFKRAGMYKRQFGEICFLLYAELTCKRIEQTVSSTGFTTNFLLALEFERYKNSLLCFGKHTPMNM